MWAQWSRIRHSTIKRSLLSLDARSSGQCNEGAGSRAGCGRLSRDARLPTCGLRVVKEILITNRINNLKRQIPVRIGQIRNPRATKTHESKRSATGFLQAGTRTVDRNSDSCYPTLSRCPALPPRNNRGSLVSTQVVTDA